MIACGGADVPLRYLRPQSAKYFERMHGVCRNPMCHSLSATCVCNKPLVCCKQPNASLCKQPNFSLSLNECACESNCCPGRWDGTRTLPGLHVLASTTKLTAVRRCRVENSPCKRSQSRKKASGERRTTGVRYACTLAKKMHAYAPSRKSYSFAHTRIPAGIRRYIDVSEYPFLVDIRRKPTGKEGAAALSRLPRPSKIMSHLSVRVRARAACGRE